MNNKEIIENFYTAFANKDAEAMVQYYDDNIEFEDPAFGKIKGEEAKNMWRMLVSSLNGSISFSNVTANENMGTANWKAEYIFTQTGRKVINNISASFYFNKGKIIKHTDHFDLWKWSRQALGIKGWLLGWTPFMQKKIQQQTNLLLRRFTNKRQEANS